MVPLRRHLADDQLAKVLGPILVSRRRAHPQALLELSRQADLDVDGIHHPIQVAVASLF
jgi:hypothetical protein